MPIIAPERDITLAPEPGREGEYRPSQEYTEFPPEGEQLNISAEPETGLPDDNVNQSFEPADMSHLEAPPSEEKRAELSVGSAGTPKDGTPLHTPGLCEEAPIPPSVAAEEKQKKAAKKRVRIDSNTVISSPSVAPITLACHADR